MTATMTDRDFYIGEWHESSQFYESLLWHLREAHNEFADAIRKELNEQMAIISDLWAKGKFRLNPKVKSRFTIQNELRMKFSWAIPNDAAIKAIAELSPIVEIGPGSGFWAKLITEAGGSVTAFDKEINHHLTENGWTKGHFFESKLGTHENLIGRPNNETLMLCWPICGKPMAYNCLRAFEGNTLVYIGEGSGGCTGDDSFHKLIYKQWEEERVIHIPQWYGMHDRLFIYNRI